jgi:hypothetical protein
MSSKPKLHDDILILMVEKVFFQEPEGDGNNTIDLRKENPYTFFMVSFWCDIPNNYTVLIKYKRFLRPTSQ